MKPICIVPNYLHLSFVCLIILLLSCCKEEGLKDNWPSDPRITLSTDRLAGHAQFSANHEYSATGSNLSIDVTIESTSGIKSFQITKTFNLKIDSSYGTNGVVTVDPSTISGGKYTFTYSPDILDVNQLIGFTFTAVNNNGISAESDLTLNVNLTPRENLPLKKWQLRSTLFVNGDPPNQESIQDCNKDDFLLLNSDGTWSMEYGTYCFLEALEGWVSWELSEDNKTLTLVKIPNVFQPTVTSTVVYEVTELTLTNLHLQQTVDMSDLGGGPNDTFLYKYVATPR